MREKAKTAEIRIDIRGLKCPFTLLEVSNAIRQLKQGQVLEIAVDSQEMADEVRGFVEGISFKQELSIRQAVFENEGHSGRALILTVVRKSG